MKIAHNLVSDKSVIISYLYGREEEDVLIKELTVPQLISGHSSSNMSAIFALSLLRLTLIIILAASSLIVCVLIIGCRSLLLNVMNLIWSVLGHVLISSTTILLLMLAGSPVICVSVVVHYCARLH